MQRRQNAHAFLRRNNAIDPIPSPSRFSDNSPLIKPIQGQGHATSLLWFALRTALSAAQNIGSFAVITHPIDDTVRRFYARWGFRELPFDPRRAMFVRMVDLARSLTTAAEDEQGKCSS